MKTTVRRMEVGGFELLEQRYSPGFALPWHRHRLAELCFLLDGAFQEVVGGTRFRYARHDTTFKPAGEGHRVDVSALGARCFVVTVPDDRFRQVAGRSQIPGPTLYAAGTVASLCARAAREMLAADAYAPLVLEGLTLQILGEVARRPAQILPNRRPPWFDRVRQRLHEDPTRPTLAELGRLAGVAPSTVAQTFHRLLGCSVGGYLRRLNVDRARLLLEDRSRSLAGIARECGFYDQSHLTRIFRRVVGRTPAAYRREVAGR